MIVMFCRKIDTPSDVSSKDTSGAPRSGRYASRSMTMPATPASATARTTASPNGTPSRDSATAKYGPIMSNSPWAKLMSRKMPKIMASPMAMSA